MPKIPKRKVQVDLPNPYDPSSPNFGERNANTFRVLPNGMIIENQGEPLPPLEQEDAPPVTEEEPEFRDAALESPSVPEATRTPKPVNHNTQPTNWQREFGLGRA